MIRALATLVIAVCAAAGALAQPQPAEPVGASRFGALVTGRTLTWGDSGLVFGQEQYLPGGRVKWLVPDGSCKLGRWWEEAPGLICFGYEDGGAPACWRFFESAGHLRAQSADDASGFLWSEIANSPEPLVCNGPLVGV